MRWALVVLAVVAGLLLAAAAVGLLLPQAHVATRSAHLDAPPERVWASIATVADYAAWRPEVLRVEPLPAVDGRPAWREHGRRDRIAYEAVELLPPRRLVTRIADRGLPFGGRWEIDLAPARGGTSVTITEHGEVYNPIFRLLSRYVFGHTATIDAYLAALARRHPTAHPDSSHGT